MASTDSRPLPLKNTAFRLYFTAYDSSGVPVTAFTSPDSELSADGGAYADATNEATYVGHGQGYIELTAAEMNYDHVGFYFSCTEGSTRDCISICPAQDASLPTNVKQINGTAQTARDIGASVLLSSGTGTGQISLSAGLVALAAGTITSTTFGNGAIDDVAIATGALTSSKFAANSLTASALAADAVTEIQSGLATASVVSGIATTLGIPTGADLSTDIAAIKSDTTLILADTGTDGVLISSGTAAGQVSLVNGIVSAYDHEGAEIAKATNLATLISRVGSFTATGANTILGMFKALLSKVATLPSDVGGTFDPATDSTEAIRDRGDAAWIGATTSDIADAVWAKTMSDLAAMPAANATALNALNAMYQDMRNKKRQVSDSQITYRDDATTTAWTRTVDASSSAYVRGEAS